MGTRFQNIRFTHGACNRMGFQNARFTSVAHYRSGFKNSRFTRGNTVKLVLKNSRSYLDLTKGKHSFPRKTQFTLEYIKETAKEFSFEIFETKVDSWVATKKNYYYFYFYFIFNNS
jgi:hypothetical protein